MSLFALYKSCDSRERMNGIGPYFSNTHAVQSGRKGAVSGPPAADILQAEAAVPPPKIPLPCRPHAVVSSKPVRPCYNDVVAVTFASHFRFE